MLFHTCRKNTNAGSFFVVPIWVLEGVPCRIVLRNYDTRPETQDTRETRRVVTSPTNKEVTRVTFAVLSVLLRHGGLRCCSPIEILNEALSAPCPWQYPPASKSNATNDPTMGPAAPSTAVERHETCDDRKFRSRWREEATLPLRVGQTMKYNHRSTIMLL